MLVEYLYMSGRFLKTLYDRFFEDGCTYRAAALTYTSLLSLVPLMTVSFAIFAAFPVFRDLSSQIQNFIFSHFIAASGEVIQQYLAKFVAQTKNLSAIGSVFLVVTAVLMMFNMEQAFNAIWKVKSRRKGLTTFMTYWAVLTLSPIFIGISIILSTYLTNLPFVSTAAQTFNFLAIFPFILNLLFFMLLYTMVPNTTVPLRYAFIGALVATILFTVAKAGFGYYVSHFPTYILLYGALATIPLFLIWLYVMWTIILFGAIISNVLATGYRFRSTKKMDGFTHAYQWLGYFWKNLQEGRQLSLGDLLSFDSCNYEIDPYKQLQLMSDAKLIQPGASGRYVLSQDLSSMSLNDLLNALPWRMPTVLELKQWDTPWVNALQETVIANKEQTKEWQKNVLNVVILAIQIRNLAYYSVMFVINFVQMTQRK